MNDKPLNRENINILRRCYYVKCPQISKDGTIKPGKYNASLMLIPDGENREHIEMQRQMGEDFLHIQNTLCDHGGHTASKRSPIYPCVLWDLTAEQQRRFEQLDLHKHVAVTIAPNSQQMHDYLSQMQEIYAVKKQEWIERFGKFAPVHDFAYDREYTDIETGDNPFVYGAENDHSFMWDPIEVTNMLHTSNYMCLAAKSLKQEGSCPFDYSTPGQKER